MIKGHTIKTLGEGFKKGEFSPDEIVADYLAKIEKEDKKINAYLSVFNDSKLRITNYELKSNPQSGIRNSLMGVPAAIKDNMLIEGSVATAGSKILKNYISSYDSTAIKKIKNAGAIFLGKTNMDEFAMGSSTENSGFVTTKNPHNLELVPGGSSGGSAAAVAADLAVFSLGSDTGGSIRQPAAFCGVVGLKPTYGRVSRHGLIAMASSLDQIGPITKNVRDSAEVLNIIAGHDHFDSTTVNKEIPDFTAFLEKEVEGLRVGVPKEFFGEGLDSEVKDRVNSAIQRLQRMGMRIEEISLPNSGSSLAVYYIIMPCEVSSNLARFDGIRYGHSSKESESLFEVYQNSRAEGFGQEVKRRVILGTYALTSGYYDAYYLKAQKVRAMIKKDFDDAFKKVDVIVGPTTPTTAFKIGDKAADPLSMYLSDIYTVPVNLAGLPGISIPCGNGAKTGMPVGFQIIGNYFDEASLLKVAHHLEQDLAG